MHFKTAALAALLATQAAALVLPRDDEVVVGGHDTEGISEAADLLAAYEESAPLIPDPVPAPIGTGSESLPEDSQAVSEAAVADAVSGGLTKRDGLFKRGSCKAQTSKYTSGPDVSKKSRSEWEAITTWKTTALGATTPSGFFQVANWRALKASAEAQPYRGYTSDLTSYDTGKCAARCKSIEGCQSFVIYFERNPTINLDKTNCPTSDAQTLIKCAFYGLPLKASQATNDGQFTGGPDPKEPNGDAFYTSIAGSNAYSIVQATPTCFRSQDFGIATIEAPKGSNTYMGIQTFPDVSYNPQVCADACNEKSAYNKRQAERQSGAGASFRKCRFFDAYLAFKNDADPMFTCAYYTTSYDSSFATNIEQFNKAGDRFSHGSSVGYTLDESCSAGSGTVQKKVVSKEV